MIRKPWREPWSKSDMQVKLDFNYSAKFYPFWRYKLILIDREVNKDFNGLFTSMYIVHATPQYRVVSDSVEYKEVSENNKIESQTTKWWY